MPNYLPIFNQVCDIWKWPNTPGDGLADYFNIPCQLYLPTKGLLDIQPGDRFFWVPPIYLRMPVAQSAAWIDLTIVAVPALSNRYYRARWKDKAHLGFPNEYLVVVLEQCDDQGIALLRDVT